MQKIHFKKTNCFKSEKGRILNTWLLGMIVIAIVLGTEDCIRRIINIQSIPEIFPACAASLPKSKFLYVNFSIYFFSHDLSRSQEGLAATDAGTNLQTEAWLRDTQIVSFKSQQVLSSRPLLNLLTASLNVSGFCVHPVYKGTFSTIHSRRYFRRMNTFIAFFRFRF